MANKDKKENKFLNGLAHFFALRSSKKKVNREDAIIVTDTLSSANECYNTLKDNFLMTDLKKNQVIQIESCVSGEGKTTLACNFAVSLSYNGIKVLVVDLDFRRPRVNKLFEVPNENGLVDYISGKLPFENLIKHTSYSGVDVVTRGSSIYNPSFLLSSEIFADLIKKFRGMYDVIILDSPPVLQISDYTHISKVSDGCLFVVCHKETTKSELAEAAELLDKAGVNVIGAVMTRVDSKDPYSYYYGNYRKYGYHYGGYGKYGENK